MASQITYTVPCWFVGISEVPFNITVTWFPQVTWLEVEIDFYWVKTPYYTAEVEW
jgi:hypothetical protein